MNSAVRMLDIAAARWPDRVGIADADEQLTFVQWRAQSQAVGAALLARGCRGPVVVRLPKSVRALVAFMGVLYSGCPYVPVDAHIPDARLDKIKANLHPAALITNAELAAQCGGDALLIDELAAHALTAADEQALEQAVDAVIDADPIYVMYTSGSTGAPKGVTVPHRGVIDYARWVVATFGFGPDTVMGNQAPFYFDNSIFDIYGTLESGARLELIPEQLLLFPGKLPQFLAEKRVTSIFWVPTVLINVANCGALAGCDLSRLTNVSFCGEVMPNKALNQWRAALPHCRYANLYGPTEISDVCSYYIVDREFADSDPLPIGRACANTRLIVLNEQNDYAAVNEPGELCVIGAGVALGYWNAPELTARAFVQNPAEQRFLQRIYRTGDLAVWDERGELIFLGRRDGQIKLKGNRIELGEIENAAICIPGVERACAVFEPEQERITLFIQCAEQHNLRRFNQQLRAFIPNYMLPGRLEVLEHLPLTPNDKIDRVKLKASLAEG